MSESGSHELAAWIQANINRMNLSQIYQLENVLHEIITPFKNETERMLRWWQT